jgi:adenine-specific DNA-methyltransferase
MNKELIDEFNKLLNEEFLESYSKDEFYLHVVKQSILNKHRIKYADYNNLIKKALIDPKKIKNINISDKLIKLVGSMDLFFLCSISEEYIGEKKREVTGSYYTPPYIIKYMVYNSLKNYFLENTRINEKSIDNLIKDEIIHHIQKNELEQLLDSLKSIKVIDISCGTGLFLLYMFRKIFNIKFIISKNLGLEFDYFKEKKYIIENNIFGIDIQSLPLEIFVLTCIDILACYREFDIKGLNFNIYQKNSILGPKIYNLDRIKEIVDKGGFDIVIGNPPYIGEKGNKHKFHEIKQYKFGKKYYEGKMDYFYYFVYRGIELLRKNGILTYITTNYFITADGASKFRNFLKENTALKNIIYFNEYEIFKSAKGQHNLIFTLVKGFDPDKKILIQYFKGNKYSQDQISEAIFNSRKTIKDYSFYTLKSQNDLYSSSGNMLIFSDKRYSNIINKIKCGSHQTLGDICNINQGIVSGADKVTKKMMDVKLSSSEIEKFNIKPNKGIFVVNREEITDRYFKNCKLLKPFYKNSDVKKYYTKKNPQKFILYFTDKNILDNKSCPIIKNHLNKFENVLSMRRETVKGVRKWYSLQWSRDESIFEKPKIVVPHRSLLNNFGYNELPWYASADVYFITAKENLTSLKLLLCLLNSKITYFWLFNMGKRKGNYLELYSKPLSQIPIYLDLDNNIKKYLLDITDKVLQTIDNKFDMAAIEHYQDMIDKKLYKIYGFNEDEIEAIEKQYRETKK